MKYILNYTTDDNAPFDVLSAVKTLVVEANDREQVEEHVWDILVENGEDESEARHCDAMGFYSVVEAEQVDYTCE